MSIPLILQHITCFSWLNTNISLIDPKLIWSKSVEMNWPQTYRGPSFYVGWRRGLTHPLHRRDRSVDYLIACYTYYYCDRFETTVSPIEGYQSHLSDLVKANLDLMEGRNLCLERTEIKVVACHLTPTLAHRTADWSFEWPPNSHESAEGIMHQY
jgi:hypothetical protein